MSAIKPWMKFYPSDWRADPRLRMCSLSARGLWIDLMSYMHEGHPYGHLTIDGRVPDLQCIAALVARPMTEVRRAISELEERKVFSRSEEGAIYSRRMVRDQAKAVTDHENGKGGGNPKVKGGVNPQTNPQKLEARIQKESERSARAREGDASLISPEAHRLADECLRASYIDHLARPTTLCGLEYQAQMWLSRGYDPPTVVLAFVQTINRYGTDKPLSYITKAVEEACTAPAPTASTRVEKPHAASHRGSDLKSHLTRLRQTADSLRESAVSGDGEASPRLLPNR